MRKNLAAIGAVILSVVLVATFATAQPGIGITKTAPLSGTGSGGSPLKITACANGETYVSNGTTWACVATGGLPYTGGDGVTITAGDIDAVAGSGVAIVADAITLALSVQNCSAGEFFDSNTSTGVFSCVAEVGDISTVTTTANMGLTGGGTSGAVSVGLLSTCADGQVLVSGGTGTTWTCGSAGAGDITGVTVTSPACSAGSYMTTLTGGATSGDAPVGGTCTSEVGDVSSVVAGTGLVTGGTSGAVTVDVACGTGIACNANDVTLNMTAQSCSAGQHISAATALGVFTCSADSGGTYTAGDGLTLTGSDFDITYTSDFTITTDQLDLSTAVTAPGSLTVATTASVVGSVLAATADNGGGHMNVGWPVDDATDNHTGYRIYPYQLNGNTYIDAKNGTGGSLIYRVGQGTQLGSNTTWLTVLGSTGASTFAALVTATAGVTTPANLTTTGTGDIVSADALTVAGNTTLGDAAGDVVDMNGDVMKVGNSVDGQFFSKNESIGFQWGTGAAATGYINYYGNGGTTSDFRSLIIANGKGVSMAYFNAAAATPELTIYTNTIIGNSNTATHDFSGSTYYEGTVPTLSSCGSCTIASYSTNTRGKVSCTDGTSTCTITFSQAWNVNPPACVISGTRNSLIYVSTAPTTGAFSFTPTAGAGAFSVDYHCDGMLGTL